MKKRIIIVASSCCVAVTAAMGAWYFLYSHSASVNTGMQAGSSGYPRTENLEVVDTLPIYFEETPLWEGAMNDSLARYLFEGLASRAARVSVDGEGCGEQPSPWRSLCNATSEIMMNDLPVGVRYEYDTTTDCGQSILRMSKAFAAFLAGLRPEQWRAIDSLCQNSVGESYDMGAVLQNLLATDFCLQKDTLLKQSYRLYIEKRLRFEDCGYDLLVRQFNPDLANFFIEHAESFFFWNERELDSTAALMRTAISHFVDAAYPQVRGALAADCADLEKKCYAPFVPKRDTEDFVCFDTNTLVDPQHPPAISSLDCRSYLLSRYLREATLALSNGFGAVSIAGPAFRNVLQQSGSRYFTTSLRYVSLVNQGNRFAWKPLVLDPLLVIAPYGWDNGVYDLGVQIRFDTLPFSGTPVLFVGSKNPAMIHFDTSIVPLASAERTVVAQSEGRYCRTAFTSYAVPENDAVVKSLCVKTHYRCFLNDENYSAPGEVVVEGQRNDGISFLPISEEMRLSGASDTSLYQISQEYAECCAVLRTGDTIPLCHDSISGGFGDGSLYLRAARCENPLQVDINGDGRKDYIVALSRGHVLIVARPDGSFNAVVM